ncbi:MAG: hypothetical protein JWL77_2020 [Chthonomonadaceae bacterium]|nr:hypothetical protein [Chthonomonadaceae bacterium]
MSRDDERFERLLQRMEPGSTLVRSWPLTGGVSAQVTALDVLRAEGHSERLVVRQHGAVDLARDPNIAMHEYALLQRLHATQDYQSLNPLLDASNLPFWDLWVALRPARNLSSWGLNPQTERTMRAALQQFIAQAITKLSAS